MAHTPTAIGQMLLAGIRMVVAAQRTHASIRMQLSGSAQDAGAHALWAWWMQHMAECKGANMCAQVAHSPAAIGQMLRAGTAAR